jgi:hypothetical protein
MSVSESATVVPVEWGKAVEWCMGLESEGAEVRKEDGVVEEGANGDKSEVVAVINVDLDVEDTSSLVFDGVEVALATSTSFVDSGRGTFWSVVGFRGCFWVVMLRSVLW